MAELRGGTTIAGFPALHSGMSQALLGGNLTINGQLNVGGTQFSSNGDNSLRMTTNSGYIEIGPKNTSTAHIYTDRASFYFNKDLSVNGNTVWHSGNTTPLNTRTDPYIGTDLAGSTAYPRLVPVNGGPNTGWVRTYSADTGILPYANGVSSIGTSSWRFRDMHATNFFENGTALNSKYAASGHNHDSQYLKLTGGTITGQLHIGQGTIYSVPGSELILAGKNVAMDGYETNYIGATDTNSTLHVHADSSFYRNTLITARSGGAPVLQIAPAVGNQPDGGTLEFLESPGVFNSASSYGFRFYHDAAANTLQLQSTAASTIVDSFTINRNTGSFTINSEFWTEANVRMRATSSIYADKWEAIRFLQGDTNGNGVVIGAGGTTIIGGGESANAVLNGTNARGDNPAYERMYITNDAHITFFAGQQNGFDATNHVTIQPDSTLTVVSSSKALQLAASGSSNHVYMEFYARGNENSTRSAYMGYGSAGTTVFIINNQMSGGDINLSPGSGGNATVAGRKIYAHWDNIKWGTGNPPSGGVDGDIYIKY